MRYIFVLIIGWMLAGCTTDPVLQIKPDQIYKGYPCFDNCESFKIGYEYAISQSFSNLEDCQIADSQQITGCQAGTRENIFENNPENDLRIQ
jgi:hypothetical protein